MCLITPSMDLEKSLTLCWTPLMISWVLFGKRSSMTFLMNSYTSEWTKLIMHAGRERATWYFWDQIWPIQKYYAPQVRPDRGLNSWPSRSWQYILCHWDACANHSAISDFSLGAFWIFNCMVATNWEVLNRTGFKSHWGRILVASSVVYLTMLNKSLTVLPWGIVWKDMTHQLLGMQ